MTFRGRRNKTISGGGEARQSFYRGTDQKGTGGTRLTGKGRYGAGGVAGVAERVLLIRFRKNLLSVNDIKKRRGGGRDCNSAFEGRFYPNSKGGKGHPGIRGMGEE